MAALAVVAAIQDIERGYTSFLPELTYSITDHLRIRASFLLIAGSRRTIVGQFHDNDEAFLQRRYFY